MAGRTAIGIVLDAGIVQAVELTSDGQRPVIRRMASQPMPPEAFTDGELTDVAAVAEAVRHLMRTHRLSRRNVCVALGGRLALARVIEITGAGAGEAEQVLQDRISRYAIYENLEVLWKATPIGPETDEKRSYLAASASKDQVGLLLPAMRRAGLHVSHLEPYALASMRSLATCAAAEERPTVLVSLRTRSTDFLIVKGPVPLLVRSIEEGAEDLTRRPEVLDDLLTETKRAVEFCHARFPDSKPRLWLCPSDIEDCGTASLLAERLKTDPESVDVEPMPAWPQVSSDYAAPESARQLWAAVGAGMVGLGMHDIIAHLNLVPADWPEIERIQKQVMAVAASIGLAVVATIVATMLIRLTVGDVARQAEAAAVEMEANTTNVKAAAQVKRKAADAAARVKLWREVRNQISPFDWSAGLEAVTSVVPEGVRISQLQYRRGTLRLIGETESTDLVHQMVQHLAKLPWLEEASIERLIRTSNSASKLPTFTVVCKFREPAPPAEEKNRDPRTTG